MVCLNCGNVSDGGRFCIQCGVELPALPDQAVTASGVIASPVAVSPPMASGVLAGRTLDQKYYLESKLGAGGMGTVYRASRLLIGDFVAIKVLNQDQMDDPRALERFRREAQIATRLKHPNVVTVYDFGVSSDGLCYLVMDLAEGESLSSLVERRGRLAETDAVEIIRQVCAGLDEAHRQGVVHRDLKPQNILVNETPDGLQVKVLDFGVASSREVATSRLTRTGSMVGTPHYMSPEHCLGEELDGRSDIYSLGIVLFEMLTGVVPFDSPTPTAIVIKHVNDPPPPLRALNPNISPAVESVALRALEKRREARPQTASEMAKELVAAAGGQGPVMPQPAMIAAPEPQATQTSEVLADPESEGAAAAPLDEVPAFGEAFAKMGSNRKSVLPIFIALILVAGGVGFWWRLHKSGNEKAAAPSDHTESVQEASAAGGQPATKLWELVADQTIGVRDAANSLGVADQQTAVIRPGGRLALEYRGGGFFGDGRGVDLRVYGPEQKRVSYIISVRNNAVEAWKRIDVHRGGFRRGPAGHDLRIRGVRRARQVMITNNGNADLRIDAVSASYKDEPGRSRGDK